MVYKSINSEAWPKKRSYASIIFEPNIPAEWII